MKEGKTSEKFIFFKKANWKISIFCEKITKKETEIIFYMIKGLTNKEIAKKMFAGYHTVKRRISVIMEKINAKNRVQLVVFAIKFGIIEI